MIEKTYLYLRQTKTSICLTKGISRCKKIAKRTIQSIPIVLEYSRGNDRGSEYSAHDKTVYLSECAGAMHESTSAFYIYEKEKKTEIECDRGKFQYCELHVFVKRFYHADATKKKETLFLIETYLANNKIISS